MFMGEYTHGVDEKGRFIIPSKFREKLGKEFVITRGVECCLRVYTKKEWDELVMKLEALPGNIYLVVRWNVKLTNRDAV